MATLPGLFIVLDGVDGAGKSTQLRLLSEWLRSQGKTVTTCRDPGGTSVGDKIRAIVLDKQNDISAETEAFLYMASRCQLVAETIRPALKQGHVVLCDRFVLASVVYQGHAGGAMDPPTLWKLGEIATGGISPNLYLVFDMPVTKALSRRNGPQDRMEAKGSAFLERVRNGFLKEASLAPDKIKIISADQPIEAIQQQLQKEVSHALERHRGA